jgi:dTDP-4-dehydrorhamnose 3,5-epimerase
MEFNRLAIPDVVEIKPSRHGDHRGYFSETFRKDRFTENVGPVEFVQENQSLSLAPGVVRGLHFQALPFAQGKLVRCMAGAIFDVAVDIRHGSPTFGHWVAATLTSDQGNQLWIPAGFLHGFCTLVPDTLVCYKVTSYYHGPSDKGVLWNDPAIGIDWPDVADKSTLSEKDGKQPRLAELPIHFEYPREQ